MFEKFILLVFRAVSFPLKIKEWDQNVFERGAALKTTWSVLRNLSINMLGVHAKYSLHSLDSPLYVTVWREQSRYFPSSNTSFLFLTYDKASWKLETKIFFHIQMLFASSHWLLMAGFVGGEQKMHARNFAEAGTVCWGDFQWHLQWHQRTQACPWFGTKQ